MSDSLEFLSVSPPFLLRTKAASQMVSASPTDMPKIISFLPHLILNKMVKIMWQFHLELCAFFIIIVKKRKAKEGWQFTQTAKRGNSFEQTRIRKDGTK